MSRHELSVAIMTHPVRLSMALGLQKRLRPEIDAKVVIDPEPDGPPRALRSARLAWGAVHPSATHHLVLQDDVMPCADFAPRLYDFVDSQPAKAISLFANWSSDTACAIRCAALLGLGAVPVLDIYAPTQGLVLPVEAASEVCEHLERADSTEREDLVVLRTLHEIDLLHLATVPCLLEHDLTPSIAGNDKAGARRAAMFSDAPMSASTGATFPDCLVVPCYQSRTRSAAVRLFERTPGGLSPVATRPISRLFAALGVPVEAIEATFAPKVASVGAATLLEPGRGMVFHETYLVAAGLGIMAAKISGKTSDELMPRLADPAVRLAFSTLMPAFAQKLLAIDELLAHLEALTALTLGGVATGLSIAGDCGEWPTSEAVLAVPQA